MASDGGADTKESIIDRMLATMSEEVWIIELSHELVRGMPTHPHHPSFTFTLVTRHGDRYREDGYSAANELIVMSGHHGTHVDALGHISVDGKLHGGVDAFEAQRGTGGLTSKSVASLGPLIGRGILVDVAGERAVAELAPGEEIVVDDVEAALRRADLEVREGDVVLFRTGWTSRWQTPEAFFPPDGAQPGPGKAVADWLVERNVGAVGSDTMVFECVKPNQNAMPVHSTLLTHGGIPIIEMLNLEELSVRGVRDFVFVALPLRIRGATGSPIRAIALAPRGCESV